MNSPEVSIIVPVFNSEKFLSKCLDSVIEQTFTNFECILINDGSTDESLSICERYHAVDKRFIVLDQVNSGLSASRNRGIETARGRYLCFFDSDDYIQSNMCEKLFTAMTNTNSDVVCSGYLQNERINKLCDEDFVANNQNTIELIHYLEMKQAFGIVWNKLYKKSILTDHNIRFLVPIKFGEDMIFNLEYFEYVKTSYISSDLLYHYLNYNVNALTKANLSFAECEFRFKHVSDLFIEIDNKSKSLFCSELLAKDFQYTIALLLRLYTEKQRTSERLVVIAKLKNFYKVNRARNKFTNRVVSITYVLLLQLPPYLFCKIFSVIYYAYSLLVRIGKSPARYIKK